MERNGGRADPIYFRSPQASPRQAQRRSDGSSPAAPGSHPTAHRSAGQPAATADAGAQAKEVAPETLSAMVVDASRRLDHLRQRFAQPDDVVRRVKNHVALQPARLLELVL